VSEPTIKERLQRTPPGLDIVPTFLDDEKSRVDMGAFSAVAKFPNGRALSIWIDPPTHPMTPHDVAMTVAQVHHDLVSACHHGVPPMSGVTPDLLAPMPDMLWHLQEEAVVAELNRLVILWLAARKGLAQAKADARTTH